MVICALQVKGGVGKTLSCIILSEILGGKKLLVDASQEQSLRSYYQVKAGPRPVRVADDLDMACVKSPAEFRRLPPYPAVIIDTQPVLNQLTLHLASVSDLIVCPVDMDIQAVEAAATVIKSVGRPVTVLPTKYAWWRPIDRKVLALMRERLTADVLDPIRYYRRASEIPFYGKITFGAITENYRRSFNAAIQ